MQEVEERCSEEKTTLEGMIQSHDELIMEMAKEYGLNRMGENDNDEDDDDDDEGKVVAPPVVMPEEIVREEDPSGDSSRARGPCG
jgi:hypothetical protein